MLVTPVKEHIKLTVVLVVSQYLLICTARSPARACPYNLDAFVGNLTPHFSKYFKVLGSFECKQPIKTCMCVTF